MEIPHSGAKVSRPMVWTRTFWLLQVLEGVNALCLPGFHRNQSTSLKKNKDALSASPKTGLSPWKKSLVGWEQFSLFLYSCPYCCRVACKETLEERDNVLLFGNHPMTWCYPFKKLMVRWNNEISSLLQQRMFCSLYYTFSSAQSCAWRVFSNPGLLRSAVFKNSAPAGA